MSVPHPAGPHRGRSGRGPNGRSRVDGRPWHASVAAAVVAVVSIVMGYAWPADALAGLIRAPAVGGVMINVDGVVSAPQVSVQRRLQQVHQQALAEIPGDLKAWSNLRKVSLRRLEAVVKQQRAANFMALPDDVKYLAGLQRVRYIFVVPEQNDIILAGPAEGWQVDVLGNVVGVGTHRPVLLLDDLVVAFRALRLDPNGMTCSIDPTAEGIQQLQQVVRRMRNMGDPQRTRQVIQQALGPQLVTIQGVAPTTHLARVMLAADFRMKRLAMAFDKAPVPGLPSYLELVKASGRGVQETTPRWWLAPWYEPLQTTPDGLTWEIRGQGVRCMTEQDLLRGDGSRQHTGRASAVAKRWADRLTETYDQLAAVDSAFGLLQNVMDLAVVAAIVEREGLLDRAGLELPYFLNDEITATYHAPKRVETQVNIIKKGRNWLISASGGVQLDAWSVTNDPQQSEELGQVHDQHAQAKGQRWWWD